MARPALRETIVGLQVCLAIVLLAGSGLLLSSYARLRHAPLGFEPHGLITFMIRPSEAKYPTAAAPALLDRVLEEIERTPGVEMATVDGCAPLSTQCANGSLRIVGRSLTNPADAPVVLRHYVSPNYFKTLRVPVIRGRGLDTNDRPAAALPGAAAGLVGALWLGRIMRATLYETSPLDPGVLCGAVFVLIAAVIAASYLPVRRALAVNPVEVLRNE